jgi:aryl-alcohol dehydrogenase-like predicted oxidoreductase
MHYRTFGRTGWQVSEIGYGMWGMGGWTGSDDAESLDSLQRSIDLGCNFFDTAWAYGNGHSEQLLGKTLQANSGTAASGAPGKGKLYVATKVPPKNRKWPSRREFSLDDCFPPDYINEYVDKSRANVGVDSLDLIQLHTWEDHWLDDPRLPRAIEQLRSSGKVRAFGISLNRWEPWNGIRAVRSGLIDAVQVIYNIFDQNPEDELFPACRENKVAVIARVPFDEGSLTGTLTIDSKWPQGDWRNIYFVPENLKASVQRAEALKPLVPAGSSLPEMALRFILNNPDVSTIIPGMRKSKHVTGNLAASDQGPLPAPLHTQLRVHRWDRTPTKWSQ